MQAVLWYADSLKPKTTLEEHTKLITDVRFSPSMSRLATSSFDKSVRIWDVDNVSEHNPLVSSSLQDCLFYCCGLSFMYLSVLLCLITSNILTTCLNFKHAVI